MSHNLSYSLLLASLARTTTSMPKQEPTAGGSSQSVLTEVKQYIELYGSDQYSFSQHRCLLTALQSAQQSETDAGSAVVRMSLKTISQGPGKSTLELVPPCLNFPTTLSSLGGGQRSDLRSRVTSRKNEPVMQILMIS